MNNKYIKIIRYQQKPLKFLISIILMKSGICRLFKIKQNGFYLHFYPSSLSAQLWISPKNRHGDESFFRAYLKKGDKVIDIGANIGNLTAVACLVVEKNGKVYSIEAHPQIYKYLLGNIQMNKFSNIKTFNYAVGKDSKIVKFSSITSDDQNQVIVDGKGISVMMKKLDDMGINEQKINLLKVDVEGYEKFVLEGSSEVLNHTECVYYECYEKHFINFGYQTNDVIDLLIKKGFTSFKFINDSTISQVSDNYISKECENLVAVKDIHSFLKRTNFSVAS